jgi:crotonobetainyl-CoA:carnitine CoA-transferase CaiB-like acyl-CoA transferase
MGEAQQPRPLEGIRVVDLTRVVAGPAATLALANLGADVIKVEPPEGDLMRKAKPRRAGIALYWAQVNCGKRCICVDLGQAEGQDLVRRLALAADVVVENFRPGVMARLGLDPAGLRPERPDLIVASISGYGQTGAAARRRAYAPILHAEIGLIDLGAAPRGIDPAPEPVSHADFAAGAQAATAICAALFARSRSGLGTHLDISMAETLLASMEWTAIEANGGMGGEIPTFYPAKAAMVRLGDGSWAQLPGSPASSFPALTRAMGRPELLEDPRFSTHERRWEHLDAMVAIIGKWAAGFPDREALEAALDAERIPVGAVGRIRDLPEQDWVQERGVFAAFDDGAGGEYLLPRSPTRSSTYEVGLRGRPAHQGEHNREVLGEVLGLGAADLDRLEASGILLQRGPVLK